MGFHISKSLKDPKPEDYLNIFQQLQVDKLKEKNLIGPDEPLKDYNYLLALDKSHTDIEYEQVNDIEIKPKSDITLAEFMIANNDKISGILGDSFYISWITSSLYQLSPAIQVTLVSKNKDSSNSCLVSFDDKTIAYFRDLYINTIKLNNTIVEINLIMPKKQPKQLKATDFI